MKYQILCAETSDDLEEQVRDAIKEGWAPLGGVAFHEYERERSFTTETVSLFTQAMTC